jgi:hypothetical protein
MPSSDIDLMLQTDYPNLDLLFAHTPLDFHEVASEVMGNLGWDFSQINTGNVWFVFHEMLPHVVAQYIPPTDSSSEYESHLSNESGSHISDVSESYISTSCNHSSSEYETP